jgi:acylphosphatase
VSGASSRVRARVVVEGRVQGVFFRGFVQEEARGRGVRGWVRNLADGRVEALLEGERTDVDAVLESMRRGPRAARVTDFAVRFEDPTGEYDDFSVRY